MTDAVAEAAVESEALDRVPLSHREFLTLDLASGLPEPDEAPDGPLGSSASWIIFGGLALIVAVVLMRYYHLCWYYFCSLSSAVHKMIHRSAALKLPSGLSMIARPRW